MDWVIALMIRIIEGNFPRGGVPVVGIFFAEGDHQGLHQGFFIRREEATDFREGWFELDMVEGKLFQEINSVLRIWSTGSL